MLLFSGNLTRKLSNASSLSSMEESVFLQASLDSSDNFSEKRNTGETTISPYYLRSMTPSAFEATLRQKEGEIASYMSRLVCIFSSTQFTQSLFGVCLPKSDGRHLFCRSIDQMKTCIYNSVLTGMGDESYPRNWLSSELVLAKFFLFIEKRLYQAQTVIVKRRRHACQSFQKHECRSLLPGITFANFLKHLQHKLFKKIPSSIMLIICLKVLFLKLIQIYSEVAVT